MLSSIHPFGERSRNNSFGRTATAHVVGSTIGGAALGVVAGLLGAGLAAVASLSADQRLGIAIAAATVALLFEATGRERMLPTRTRQVDENWIQTYRGWVYGGGWGAELGFGVSTIITTSLVHLLVVVMIIAGSFSTALVLGTIFGLVRGATVLAAATVDTPERLRSFHQSLDAMRGRARSGAVAALALSVGIGLIGIAA